MKQYAAKLKYLISFLTNPQSLLIVFILFLYMEYEIKFKNKENIKLEIQTLNI